MALFFPEMRHYGSKIYQVIIKADNHYYSRITSNDLKSINYE